VIRTAVAQPSAACYYYYTVLLSASVEKQTQSLLLLADQKSKDLTTDFQQYIGLCENVVVYECTCVTRLLVNARMIEI
jgi:hypothetical protein